MTQPPESQRFQTTQWSLVNEAREPGVSGEAALGRLFEIYWKPVYAYARRCGLTPADAEDAVQGFFLTAFKRKLFARAEPGRGRLRGFLLTAFNRYLIDVFHRQSAQKRNPADGLPYLDFNEVEERLLADAASGESPSAVFDREWAHTVLREALRRLRARYEEENRLPIFAALRPYLSDPDAQCPQQALAQSLGMTPSAVGVALHRLRKRYREAMRATIEDTIEGDADPEEEFRELTRILTQPPS